MNYILSLIICSGISNTCLPPINYTIIYESTYKCLIDGYKNSITIMEEIGEEEVNKNDLYAKFVCIKKPKEEKEEKKISENI
tara:strand:- start:273 stop:518 length:246 start_codon:yes stop_codon:yes gene_type:complete